MAARLVCITRSYIIYCLLASVDRVKNVNVTYIDIRHYIRELI